MFPTPILVLKKMVDVCCFIGSLQVCWMHAQYLPLKLLQAGQLKVMKRSSISTPLLMEQIGPSTELYHLLRGGTQLYFSITE